VQQPPTGNFPRTVTHISKIVARGRKDQLSSRHCEGRHQYLRRQVVGDGGVRTRFHRCRDRGRRAPLPGAKASTASSNVPKKARLAREHCHLSLRRVAELFVKRGLQALQLLERPREFLHCRAQHQSPVSPQYGTRVARLGGAGQLRGATHLCGSASHRRCPSTQQRGTRTCRCGSGGPGQSP
jgi:hypothetical protein